MTNHLFDAIRSAAAASDPLLIGSSGNSWNYGDMIRRSGQIASVLDGLGVRPGDRVMAQVEKSPQALMLYLACLRTGAVYIPLNTAYTFSELQYFIEDAVPRVIVCAPQSRSAIDKLASQFGTKSEILDADGRGSLAEKAEVADAAFDDAARGPEDLAAILYTSGTTGRAKGAMLTHGNLLSNALALKDYWHFSSQDRLIHVLPIFHSHGLFVACNVTLLSGASMYFLRKFDANDVVRLMAQASVLMGIPTYYVRLLQNPNLTPVSASKMRLFISGSAPLLAETRRAFEQCTGQAILERYGMTETNMNTSNPYDGDRIAGTVGFPLPGTDLRVTAPETGEVLPRDETGMLEVRGPNVFKGYWRMAEKTKAELRPDGFFITGDLGKIDQRGYVHILGRGKDLVISGGYNVYPKEVESEIDRLEGVVESAVIGVPHPDFGEGVTAIVVKKMGAAIDEGDVIDALKERLARYKQPKRVLFVDELPRNTMGKVQKNLLRDRYRDIYATQFQHEFIGPWA